MSLSEHPLIRKKAAGAPERFQEVQQAYETLNDDAKRRQYDREVAAAEGVREEMPKCLQCFSAHAVCVFVSVFRRPHGTGADLWKLLGTWYLQ